MANNSIKGFKVGNEVKKYDYDELDNLPENDPDDLAEQIGDLKSDLNYGHTAPSGYVLRATNEGHGNEWAMVGTPTDAQAETAINAWLDDHPEATTTVQDGAITEVKFTDSLKLKTIKDYVTPEMFGAKGDGVTDDATATQDAINTGKTVYFSSAKTYLIGQSVYLKQNVVINDGTIYYTGNQYAFVINTTLDGATYYLGTVRSNGGVLLFDSTSAWMQYINIYFRRFTLLTSSSSAIYAKVVGTNWINEIRINDGRFNGGTNGVYIDHSEKTGTGLTSHWTFNKVGFEGVKNGVNIPSLVSRMAFTDCRAEESIENVVFSRASEINEKNIIAWQGAIANGLYWNNCNYYFVCFANGYFSSNGVLVTFKNILLYNGVLHGLRYNEGIHHKVSDYGAYSYDAETHEQAVDFSTILDYSTEGYELNSRIYTRIYTIDNNKSATKTNVYLDDRLFLNDFYSPESSYLLLFTLSPNVQLKIYNKVNGTEIYSKTGTSVTTYPVIKVTKSKNLYMLEEITFQRKQV